MTKNTIARKLILYVVLFSSLLTLLITVAQLYYDYSIELDNIHDSLANVEKVHLNTISSNVWAVDREGAKIQLEGILEVPDLEYIEISENGKLWLNAGKRDSKNVIEKTYPILYFTRGENREIGQLKVVASLDLLYNRLINKALTILLSNGIKTFLVAGFMLVLFYHLVTRHIIKIADFVRDHDLDAEKQDTLTLDISDKEKPSENELVTLTNHLNTMQHKITNSYETLKSSEEKYRRLVEMAQEGIWTIDDQGLTVFVNPSMARMLGYSVEEMMGKHLFDFMDQQGKEIATRNMERRRSGIQEIHDFEFLRKDGQRIFATLATSPIFDSNNTYIGAIAGVMDITERVKAEKKLKDYQAHLEDTVNERTKALQVSNTELEAFSYSVAHDLRTPLRSITSFSQILKEEEFDNLSPDGRYTLDRIIRAGLGMSKLIDELLELSRISRAEIQYTRVDITALSKNIVNNLIAQQPDRKCKITVSENLEATADKTLMTILLQNLIQNAWKFTRNSDVCEIEIGENTENGDSYFYVKDNGIGFDMRYKHKLFEAFQRLHDSDFSGNGIGLATVKRILTRHNGKIWAISAIDSGATFYFSIPQNPGRQSSSAEFKAVS